MFAIETTPEATIVRVQTDIDFAVEAEFLEVLSLACDGGSAPLIVSLEECPYMDCAGLSVLVKIRNAMRAPMSVVVRGDSFLSKLLVRAGLEGRLHVTNGLGSAVAA